MKKNKVTVCTGTTCFVMGGSELLLLEEQLPGELKALTEIEGSPCLGACKRGEGEKTGHAPFVRINGEILEEASAPKIIEYLETLEGR